MGLGRTFRIASAAGIAGLVVFVLPPAASYGATINVAPGHSIQAAVNAAAPGDTVRIAAGTYHESVEITKSLNIVGAGQRATVILPPATAPSAQSAPCFDPASPTEFNGLCIHGVVDSSFNVTSPVGPVSVHGLTVKNFTSSGVLFFGAPSPHVDHVTANGDGEYGIVAFVSTDDVIDSNVAKFNGEAGIYVGDSPNAH